MNNKNLLLWLDSLRDGCKASDSQLFFEREDLLVDLPGRFRLAQCSYLDLIHQNPTQDETLTLLYRKLHPYYKNRRNKKHSIMRYTDRRYSIWDVLASIIGFFWRYPYQLIHPGGWLVLTIPNVDGNGDKLVRTMLVWMGFTTLFVSISPKTSATHPWETRIREGRLPPHRRESLVDYDLRAKENGQGCS